jgi:hypothetical protein
MPVLLCPLELPLNPPVFVNSEKEAIILPDIHTISALYNNVIDHRMERLVKICYMASTSHTKNDMPML